MEIEEFMESIEGSIKERVQELAESVEKKLGIPKEDIIKEYQAEKDYLEGNLDTDNDKLIQRRAWVRLRGNWKSELRSDAPVFNGVVLGASDPFDLARWPRAQALEKYEEDPEKAIEEGYVNKDGEPLDTRKTFKSGNRNPRYGQPLPETNFIRNIIGVCKEMGTDKIKKFRMTLNGEQATDVEIPLFKPVRFRANVQKTQNDPKWLGLNAWSRQKFSPVETDFEVMDVLNHKEVRDLVVDLEDLPEWHQANSDNPQSVMLVEGDAEYIDSGPNPTTGNLRMVIATDALGMEDFTVWVPEHVISDIDFGAGSRVLVTGSTTQTEFEGDINYMINAWGVYAYPDLKVHKDEVSEQALEGYAQIV